MFGNLFGSGAVKVERASEMAAGGDAVLIDVRTKQEWKQGHAPDARHISLASLDQQLHRIPDDRPLLIICQSGSRSARAVAGLKWAGYDARNVEGGMSAWKRAGLAMTR